MLKLKPYSASLLAVAGLILAAMGVYFVFLRPSLLPEDLRYMELTIENAERNAPRLATWLQKVFLVMGSFIFTTGTLTVFIAQTSFRNRVQGAFGVAALAGISSIGIMTLVNFIINSDYKWVLLCLAISWLVALLLYCLNK